MNENIEYKYNELKALKEIARYVENTYGEHYAQGKYQATEFIVDGGHGTGFTVGNILKYAQRYGRKGTPDDWRKDLMKVIHYSIIALHVHDLDHPTVDRDEDDSAEAIASAYRSAFPPFAGMTANRSIARNNT
jgi:hypothetical protein